jgi:hypothetical protein
MLRKIKAAGVKLRSLWINIKFMCNHSILDTINNKEAILNKKCAILNSRLDDLSKLTGGLPGIIEISKVEVAKQFKIIKKEQKEIAYKADVMFGAVEGKLNDLSKKVIYKKWQPKKKAASKEQMLVRKFR